MGAARAVGAGKAGRRAGAVRSSFSREGPRAGAEREPGLPRDPRRAGLRLQRAHLAVPPAAAEPSSAGAPRDSAPTRSPSLGPLRSAPRGTGPPPRAFRKGQRDTHTHIHGAQSRLCALGRGEPGAIFSPFSSPRRRAGHCSSGAREAGRKRETAKLPAGSGRRAGPRPGKGAADSKAKSGRALERSRVRPEGGSTLAAAEEGGERRRN